MVNRRLPWSPLRGVVTRIDATTIRFLMTGVSAAGFFFCSSFGLVRAGLPPFWGTLLAYAITVVLAYATQQAWTFRGQSRHGEAFPRYLAVQVGCGLLSALLARLLALGGVSPLPMAAVTTVVSSGLSYLLSRYWVFAARA